MPTTDASSLCSMRLPLPRCEPRLPVSSLQTPSADPEASSYAVIGTGVNGAETVRMLVAHGAKPLVWDLDEDRRKLVADRLGARVAVSGTEALACEVVLTVTPGAEVLYADGSLEPGQHISLMGADGPGKAEVASRGAQRAHTSSATTGSRRERTEQERWAGRVAAGSRSADKTSRNWDQC